MDFGVLVLGLFWLITGSVGILYNSNEAEKINFVWSNNKKLSATIVASIALIYLLFGFLGIITKGSVFSLITFILLAYPVYHIWHDILPLKRR